MSTHSLMTRVKGQETMEKMMAVMVLFLLVGLSQSAGLQCKTDSDCRRNVCINLSCSPRSSAGGPCAINSHCFNSTNVCITQRCASLSPPGGTCDTGDSSDCAISSSSCTNNVCLSPTGGQCTENDQCASSSESCIGETCSVKSSFGESCDLNDNEDCVLGAKCEQTTCLFDPSLLEWEGYKSMPFFKGHSASVAVGDYLYVFGGRVLTASTTDLTNSVEMYNPQNNSWISKASMPVATWKHSVVAVGSLVYLIGGSNLGGNGQTYFYQYDTQNNVWTTLPQLITGVHSTAAAAVGTTIYTFGGQTGFASSTAQSAIFSFDTASPSGGWSPLAVSLPMKLTKASAVSVENSIYITGGTDDQNIIQTKTFAFDTIPSPLVSPQDLNIPLTVGRSYHASFFDSSTRKIHLVGGVAIADKAKTVETLSLSSSPVWTPEPTASLNLINTANSGGLIGSKIYLAGWSSSSSFTGSSLLFVLDISSLPRWIPFSSPQTPTHFMAVAKFESSIVSAAGVDQQGFSVTGTNKYDIPSDSWTPRPAVSSESLRFGYAAVGAELFMIGGSYSALKSETFALNADQTAWESRTSMNVARQGLCAASEGTKIFAFGGSNAVSVLDTMEIYEADKSRIGIYNTWRDVTISSKTSGNNPTPVQNCAAVSTGTKILIFGGMTGTSYSTETGLIQSFDIASETWDAPFSAKITPRIWHSASFLNGFVIVSGGTVDVSTSLATVEAFEVSSGKVSVLADLPSPRYGHGSLTDGFSVFVVGGLNGGLIAPLEKLRIPSIA